MKLGYARVSTSDQKASMPVEALVATGVAEDKIFIDQMSGVKSAKDAQRWPSSASTPAPATSSLSGAVDRLGRSLVDVVNTVNEIQSEGVSLYSIMDGVDASTAHGRLQLALFASLAEYEGELINEHPKRSLPGASGRCARQRGASVH